MIVAQVIRGAERKMNEVKMNVAQVDDLLTISLFSKEADDVLLDVSI